MTRKRPERHPAPFDGQRAPTGQPEASVTLCVDSYQYGWLAAMRAAVEVVGRRHANDYSGVGTLAELRRLTVALSVPAVSRDESDDE